MLRASKPSRRSKTSARAVGAMADRKSVLRMKPGAMNSVTGGSFTP